MLSSCLPPNLPCDFPSIRIRVCTCFNEQYICRYCRETYYVILNRVQYASAFLCERFPLNTFLFTVMKSKLSCFIVLNMPCWHNCIFGAHGINERMHGIILHIGVLLLLCNFCVWCMIVHPLVCKEFYKVAWIRYRMKRNTQFLSNNSILTFQYYLILQW